MDEIERLILGYRTKGILVDSNLLLVYCVGMYDPERIQRFKRTAAFSIDDFYLLARLIQFFQKVVTTPNILTEVNSFSSQLSEPGRSHYYAEFSKQISSLDEHYLDSAQISNLGLFQRFGLTDAGIAQLASGKYLVLSDDLKLVTHLQAWG
jgi:hypothetical protein